MKLKEIGTFISDIKDGKQLAYLVETFKSMSSWQKKIIASSTQLTAAQKAYFAAATSATAATTAEGAAATGATTGITAFGAALKGAAASALSFITTIAPILPLVLSVALAFKKAYDAAHAYENAMESANTAKSNYDTTISDLESVNEGLKTASSRIEELQSKGTLTLTEQAELEKLQSENAELEKRAALLENVAAMQQRAATNTAMDALNTVGSQSKYSKEHAAELDGAVGYKTELEAAKEDLEYLQQLYKTREDLQNRLQSAASSGNQNLYDDLTKQLNDTDKEISDWTISLGEQVSQFEEYKSVLEQDTNLGEISGGQEMLSELTNFIDAFANVGKELTPAQEALSHIQSFFDGSTSKNIISDAILDMVEKGSSAEQAINKLGLSLEDLGLEGSQVKYLNQYFNDLAASANNAANAVDEIDSSLSGIEKASESQNAGDNFDKYLSYIDNARRYYAQGKTGIDDFKTVAASLNNNSQDAEENLKQFKGNLDKIKKYLTVDTDSKLTQSSSTSNVDGNIKSSITLDDGQLTVTKQNMLDLADAFEVARKKAASTGTEFKSTADLAEALDVPIDFLEYALGKMQDYDISTAFDDLPKASQNLNDAKTELSALQELYNNMDAGSQKDALGEKIADWKTQISAAEDDLSKLDTDIVLHMKIAYNLAEMQNEIDEARALAQSGGGTTAYAASIAAQEKKNTYQEHQMGLDREGVEVPVVYTAAKDAKDKLQAELNKAAESGDSELVAKLQPQVDDAAKLVGDIQNAIHEKNPTMDLNMNVDEANAKLDEWEKSNAAKDVLINYVTDGQEPPEQMDALMDYVLKYQDSPEDMNALLNYIKNHQDNPDEMNAMLNYLKAYQDNPEAMSAALTYWKKHQDDPDSSTASLRYYWGSQDPAKDDDANVNYKRGEQDPPKNMWAWVRYIFTGDGGGDDAAGTAHSNGSASSRTDNTNTLSGLSYAVGKTRGDWSVGSDQTALVNEIGYELIVRNGHWFIANNGFPGFVKLKRNDIVFSAGQTKALLEHGRTSSYGKFIGAFSSGTAGGKSFATGSIGGRAFASGSTSSSTTTVDWLEILLDRAERIVKQFTNKLENTFKGFNSRMSALTSAISSTKTEISKNQSAYNAYMQKANSVKLSDSLKKQVREGAYYIYDYDEKTQELIQSYKEYYEKALDAKDAIDELTKSLSELYKEAFDIVATRYDNEFAALNNRSDMISNSIDLAEAGGYFANIESYSDLIKIAESKIAKGQQEYADLTKKLNEAVASGAVEKYSDEWWDMYNQILEVANGIQEAQIAVAEFEEAVRELKWEQFDFLQERISQITEEADFLIGLLENSDLFDDAGQFTSEGLATVSLRAVNYNTYMAQAKQYAEELKNIEAELANDPSNKNLIERREELLGLQRDSIEAAYDERDAIADLIQDGIDAEMDAVEKLIDAYTDALDSAKDLYEYRKKVADYSDDIANLRKQLIAYQGDTSEEARAQVQKITVDLAEAEENLREAEYDQYISDQKKMLDEFKSDYQAALNERLDNLDSLIEQLIADSNANSADVTAAINEAAANAGYTLTDNMTEILSDTNGQIAGVTSVLSDIAFQVQNIVNAVGKISTDENGIPILNEDGTPVYEVKVAPKVYQRQFSDTSRVKTSNKSTLAEFEPVSQSGLQNYSVSLQAAQIDFPYANSVAVENTGNSSTTNQISVSAPVTVSIDHVLDYNDFVTQLQNDPQFEKMVQMMTVDQLTGKSSLEKYKLKWRGH